MDNPRSRTDLTQHAYSSGLSLTRLRLLLHRKLFLLRILSLKPPPLTTANNHQLPPSSVLTTSVAAANHQTKAPLEEARKKIWLVDSKGLIVSSRKDSLQHFKKPWAHEHEPAEDLLDVLRIYGIHTVLSFKGLTSLKSRFAQRLVYMHEVGIFAPRERRVHSVCTETNIYVWSWYVYTKGEGGSCNLGKF